MFNVSPLLLLSTFAAPILFSFKPKQDIKNEAKKINININNLTTNYYSLFVIVLLEIRHTEPHII